jgi:hypothetical protein
LPDCVEDPLEEGYQAAYARRCWTDRLTLDAFGADGRYLGEVQPPAGLGRSDLMVIDDRRVIAAIEDPDGTLMVKRYRLVLPGEGER